MKKFIVQILSNALAIYLAAWLIQGFDFTGGWITLILTGFVLGMINFFIRPILKFISFPLIILSLGLFTIIINMILLGIAGWLIPELTISGIWPLFWGVVVISIVNLFFSFGAKK